MRSANTAADIYVLIFIARSQALSTAKRLECVRFSAAFRPLA
jgi:hypothetical protein